jgi:iron uptake system component EfeO
MTRVGLWPALCASGALFAACSGGGGNASYEAQATLQVKDYVQAQLDKLNSAAVAIQKAAPEPDDDGWNANDDRQALDKMRGAWRDARNAYERVEGTIAIVFHDLDVSTDQRYDGFIETEPDDDLFDGQGVTGVHAVERILWADSHPARVVKFERSLPGYQPAAFPATREQAAEFKSELCERLVADTRSMRDQFAENALDAPAAFRGMIGSTQEQSEKTTKAATGEDESRYAQHTLDDMRSNLEGARAVFAAFRPWIDSSAGQSQSRKIVAGFDEVAGAYSAIEGSALPEVPDKFNPDNPTEADLNSPYGKLWQLLNRETNPDAQDSLVSNMADAANSMGIEGIRL